MSDINTALDFTKCNSSIFTVDKTTTVVQTYCREQGVEAEAECISPYLYRNLEFIKCNIPIAADINKETDKYTASNVFDYFFSGICQPDIFSHESSINGTIFSCQSKCSIQSQLPDSANSSAISTTIPTLSITFVALFFAFILSFKRNH